MFGLLFNYFLKDIFLVFLWMWILYFITLYDCGNLLLNKVKKISIPFIMNLLFLIRRAISQHILRLIHQIFLPTMPSAIAFISYILPTIMLFLQYILSLNTRNRLMKIWSCLPYIVFVCFINVKCPSTTWWWRDTLVWWKDFLEIAVGDWTRFLNYFAYWFYVLTGLLILFAFLILLKTHISLYGCIMSCLSTCLESIGLNLLLLFLPLFSKFVNSFLQEVDDLIEIKSKEDFEDILIEYKVFDRFSKFRYELEQDLRDTKPLKC